MPEIVDCPEVREDASLGCPAAVRARRAALNGEQPRTCAEEITLGEGLDVWSALVLLVSDSDGAYRAGNNVQLYEKAIDCLKNGRVRDHILMRACNGSLSQMGEEISRESMEEMLCDVEERLPDMKSIEQACDVLDLCCRYARENQGYPFALIGYLLWWSGNFRSAQEYVEEALRRDPSNSLGTLVFRVLRVGVIPPWIAGKCVSLHSKSLE